MIRSAFFALLLLLATSCGSSGADGETASDQPQESAPAETAATGLPMSGDNYTIEVVNSEPASPRKEMRGTIADAEVVVNYGSPAVKGRVIWGELEAYGQVWRAGANEATRITIDKGVVLEGQSLEPGTYGLFVIPREEGDWTVILNTEAEQWGAYEYDESKDALRVEVTPRTTEPHQETLEYHIDGNELVLRWAKVALPISVEAAVQ